MATNPDLPNLLSEDHYNWIKFTARGDPAVMRRIVYEAMERHREQACKIVTSSNAEDSEEEFVRRRLNELPEHLDKFSGMRPKDSWGEVIRDDPRFGDAVRFRTQPMLEYFGAKSMAKLRSVLKSMGQDRDKIRDNRSGSYVWVKN